MNTIEVGVENTLLAQSASQVDALNAEFYGRFPYPWPPMQFVFWEDVDLQRKLLNQDIGEFEHSRLPRNPKIWVAGCGTNQAIFTALGFPDADVIGSDLSVASLEACARTKEQLGIKNLELRCESLNSAGYQEQFDYVICTGVIHHNYNPGQTLAKLRQALVQSGVMELMVYNRFHRIATTSVQKAIRLLLSPYDPKMDCEADLRIAVKLIDDFRVKNSVYQILDALRGQPKAMVEDTIIQPVERSYTIATFANLAAEQQLDILQPVICPYDRAQKTFDWFVDFEEPELLALFEALPDKERWHVANLLLLEKSPMIWFYLQRTDCKYRRCSELEANARFLATRFKHLDSMQGEFRRDLSDGYRHIARRKITLQPPALFAKLYEICDGKISMDEALKRAGLPASFSMVRRARVQLTTTAFPYLISC